ncbi:MAG: hypothetical protein HYV42_02400 [Candidatus Magasanikbacteria bacterium]|nr:hypothetical protein [Candidatus Magasanikbacteria bacterium]
MNPKFTSRQKSQAGKLLEDMIESLGPSKDDLQRVLTSKAFQPRLREVLVALMARYFLPLTDEEALAWLVEQAQKSGSDAKRLVDGCRKGALEQGLANSVPCHFAVEAGATLKQTIPTLGPCVEDFKHLQDWSFADVPTEHCLISGVPAALRETTSQNMATQLTTLGAVENRWGVPPGFFSKELLHTVYVAGVALTHFNLKKRDMFFGDLWVRTGTCDADGYRLELFWDQGRLSCDDWHWDEFGSSYLAVAALGVTKALGH